MSLIKVGIVQFDILTGKTDENLKEAVKGIRKLADDGANLVVMPEMFSCSFDNENLQKHCIKTPEVLSTLKKTAVEKKVVIASSMPEIHDNKIFNTFFIIDIDGKTAGRYKKIHLFTLTKEHHYFANGIEPVVCETSIGKIGMMICYDLRFPELCRKLTDKGAEIVIVSAQWPTQRVEHWETLLKARAIENQVFVAAANRSGKTSLLDYPGKSQIITPWGKVIAQAGNNSELICCVIDTDEIKQAREKIPCLKERVPEAYA